MPNEKTETIAMCHVTAGYEGRTILKDWSIKLPEQGGVCLFGPSGCGKSTMIRVLCGLLPAAQGRIEGTQGKRIAYLFQEERLLPWASALENVCMVAERAKAQRYLEALGLKEEEWLKRPKELSGGQRQRVAIARAFAYDGDFLILDEPGRGLDGENQERVYQLTEQFAAKKPVLLITHDAEQAVRLSEELYQLEGPPLEIKRKFQTKSLSEKREAFEVLSHERTF